MPRPDVSQSPLSERSDDVELRSLDHVRSEASLQNLAQDNSERGTSLPPADSGKDAWLFVAGAFVTEAIVWGFPLSYGIFQSYYSTHEPFQGDGRIPTIGTTATGLMYMSFPLILAMNVLFPTWRLRAQIVSLVLMCAGLVGSSFASTVPQLIATQGVLYALGGSVIYCWMIIYLDQWFVKRKGLAYGITWAGTGFAGVVIPPVLQALLDRLGYQTALRAWAATTFLLLAPTIHFMKPRLPPARTRRIDLKFLLSPAFIILQLGNIVQSLGYFIPAIYLPTYASFLGGSNASAATTLLAFNVAVVVGSIGIGALVDRFHVTTCTGLCAIGSTISVFLFWGMTTGLPLLFVFAVGYGLTAGSVSSAWPGIMNLVTSKIARAEPTMIMGFLAAGRGIGNIISGPVSESLLASRSWVDRGKPGYGSSYGPLIVFTGITAFCGGLTILARAKPGLL